MSKLRSFGLGVCLTSSLFLSLSPFMWSAMRDSTIVVSPILFAVGALIFMLKEKRP